MCNYGSTPGGKRDREGIIMTRDQTIKSITGTGQVFSGTALLSLICIALFMTCIFSH